MKLPTEELDVPCYPICQKCGDISIEAKCDIQWDVEKQTWSTLNHIDYYYCYGDKPTGCGIDISIYWIPVNGFVGPLQQYAYTHS